MPDDGATPIDEDERDALIPDHLTTRAELNQWEALNIAKALESLEGRRTPDPLTLAGLNTLHRRMFGATWKWAGQFRQSDTNVSPHHWTEVPRLTQDLVDNIKQQYATSDKTPVSIREIGMRFHHLLVRIHPWPNGNGRVARLATDLLLGKWGVSLFTWGRTDLEAEGEARTRYIEALRAADGWDYGPLREFLRG